MTISTERKKGVSDRNVGRRGKKTTKEGGSSAGEGKKEWTREEKSAKAYLNIAAHDAR